MASSSEDFIIRSDEDQSKLDEIERADSVIAKVMANEIFMLHSRKALKHKRYKKVTDVLVILLIILHSIDTNVKINLFVFRFSTILT